MLIFYSFSLKALTHPQDPAAPGWTGLGVAKSHLRKTAPSVPHTDPAPARARAAARFWLFIRNDTGKTECLPSDPGQGHTDGFQAQLPEL